MTNMPGDGKIKEIAYELWEREGKPEGRDLEHYFQAEKLASSGPVKTAPKTKTIVKRVPRAKTGAVTRKPAAKKTTATG